MNATRRCHRRRGYILLMVLVTMFMVIAFATALARLAVLDFSHERQAAFEARAEQVIASAQSWTQLHSAEVVGDEPCALPLADLLPPGFVGTITVQRVTAAGGETVIQCQITLERGRKHLRRQVTWPLPATVGVEQSLELSGAKLDGGA